MPSRLIVAESCKKSKANIPKSVLGVKSNYRTGLEAFRLRRCVGRKEVGNPYTKIVFHAAVTKVSAGR